MASLKEASILDLPDEIIEHIMIFLSFADLFKLSKEGKRLEDCVKRVSKKKPVRIALIGRNDYEYPEEISIINDSLFHINTGYISTQMMISSPVVGSFQGSQFTQLPNGDWLICGGFTLQRTNDKYMLFKQGSNQWTKVGTMKRDKFHHSCVYIDGVLLTIGGLSSSHNLHVSSHHEQFSFEGGVKDRKELPIALHRHSATIFGNHKVLISGGCDFQSKPSLRTFVYDLKEDNWTEGPPLLTPRFGHFSCAVQSDDGSMQRIIIFGGMDGNSKTTEILNIQDQTWAPGPTLPCVVRLASCVLLPPIINFACVIVGKRSEETNYCSNVYGLNRTLTEWTLLGTFTKYSHICINYNSNTK